MKYLESLDQWILVKIEPKGDTGKTNKLPYNWLTLLPHDAHDSAAWTTYEVALVTATMQGPGWGVGFVITGADDVFCVDIDGAKQADGSWSPLAQSLVAMLPGCMVEVSQSGAGLHIWGRYPSPPPHAKKNTALHIECYTELRFILIGTGQIGQIAPRCDAFPGFLTQFFPPPPTAQKLHGNGPCPEWRGPTDDDELIRRARMSRSAGSMFGQKASFEDLWTANDAVLARNYRGQSSAISRRSGRSKGRASSCNARPAS